MDIGSIWVPMISQVFVCKNVIDSVDTHQNKYIQTPTRTVIQNLNSCHFVHKLVSHATSGFLVQSYSCVMPRHCETNTEQILERERQSDGYLLHALFRSFYMFLRLLNIHTLFEWKTVVLDCDVGSFDNFKSRKSVCSQTHTHTCTCSLSIDIHQIHERAHVHIDKWTCMSARERAVVRPNQIVWFTHTN